MLAVPFDEESFDSGELEASGDRSANPVDQLLQEKDAKRLVDAALERLPEESARRSSCGSSKACRTRRSPPSRGFPSER